MGYQELHVLGVADRAGGKDFHREEDKHRVDTSVGLDGVSEPGATVEDMSSRGKVRCTRLGVGIRSPVSAAHSPNGRGAWHLLADHVADTGGRTARFGPPDPRWQRYLGVASSGRVRAGVSPDHRARPGGCEGCVR